MTQNAVTAVAIRPTYETFAQEASFDIALTAHEVFALNAELTTKEQARAELRHDPVEYLGRQGVTIDDPDVVVPDDLAFALTPEEIETFQRLVDLLSDEGREASRAFEAELARNGYGMPALVVIALVVAVYTTTALWKCSAG
ncbi:MAG TPA: hypothetical protein VK507_11230 [Iamia sp.]|nr:hypothetical protein [Iamia sp.]